MRASLSLCLALVACPSGQVMTTEAEAETKAASAADGGTTAATASTTASPTTSAGPTTATPGNLPPLAELADDLKVDQAAPLQVKFTSVSSDPDGTIVATKWDFGDGEQAEGAAVTHVFVNEGSFAVTLTVTDDDGASAQAKVSVVPGGCPSFKPGAWQGDLAAPALSEA